MIVKMSDIYSNVAEKNDIPLELITSIGTTVFSELLEKLMNPHEISYELPRLGAFNLRHDMFEKYYRTYMNYVRTGAIKNTEDIKRVQGIKQKINQFRLLKQESKQERNEYKANQPSEDKPEEY